MLLDTPQPTGRPPTTNNSTQTPTVANSEKSRSSRKQRQQLAIDKCSTATAAGFQVGITPDSPPPGSTHTTTQPAAQLALLLQTNLPGGLAPATAAHQGTTQKRGQQGKTTEAPGCASPGRKRTLREGTPGPCSLHRNQQSLKGNSWGWTHHQNLRRQHRVQFLTTFTGSPLGFWPEIQ